MKKKKKIIRYRRNFHINIGIVVFAFVLIYFLISVLSYVISNHVSTYEVQKGHIANNINYTGLALRSEKVEYANSAGSVNYYKKEGDKAGYNDCICSIDKTGEISGEITEAGQDSSNLSKDELVKVQDLIKDYSETYSDQQFYNVYSFKDSINSNIQENLYQNALDSLSSETDTAVSRNTFSFITAEEDGILGFYTDGYEDITVDTFKASMFDQGSYTKNNLKNNTSVSKGQALFKIADSEIWYIIVPLTEDQNDYYSQMQGDSDSFVIKVTFKKDDCSTYATASLLESEDEYFLKLQLNNSMVRYISDRYIDIELGSDSSSGLKIPNSAIIEKEFLVIPKDYVGKGDNSSTDGVLKVTKDKKGNETIEFIATDLYYETEDSYYVDEEDLAVGDTIQMQETGQEYTIMDTATLEGVYNMNKGYAVFKEIEIIAQNEEYTIVNTGTSYGLALYDHIAMDGTDIDEGELAN